MLCQKDDPHFGDCLKEGFSIDVCYIVVRRSLVKKFHDKGLDVNVWTINNKLRQNRVRRLGVDYITSNVYYEN